MSTQALIQLMPLVLLIVIMYFLLIRPQKKREKAINQMRSSIKVGDEIITIGGICGRVLKTKDEKLTIEVGADKTKFEIMRWAVSKVVNPAEEAAREAAQKAAPKAVKGKRAAQKTEKEPEKTAENEPAAEAGETAEQESEKPEN